MGGGHSHGHAHVPETGSSRYRGRLVAALLLSLVVLVAEVVGSIVTNSLALLADAGHVLTDVLGLTLALVAIQLAKRPANDRRTYGYLRAEVLAAAINALLLVGVAVYVLVEAVRRWDHPPEIDGWVMAAIATVGLVANTVALVLLRGGAEESLNVRGAYLEVLGDLVGSAAVVIAAVVIAVTGWDRADVVASLLVGVVILPRAWSLLRDTLDVVMLATPRDVDVEGVRQLVLQVDGVQDVHDVHVWTVTSGVRAMSAHVVVDDDVVASLGHGRLLDRLCECLAKDFDVEHSTFQIEPAEHAAHEEGMHR